ncbi:esterase/lipase family protein [Aspergillus brunneoviolaceus CBS 621.78]|uniref:Alpha/beta-hydrolase n=1 Tax=Aspergillus brunneoviolaceus CBS 621.78 TaxID=1450534 RepID=A0ACD1GMC9_9EURO|nr:alpha/beta-hydrolase [Aspergillus brunneoviolaceus CBS 621.78]RAH50490.1 alpha/beta-hydrolase [Aspergillus brunneoviolaceus CBS 621.78]
MLSHGAPAVDINSVDNQNPDLATSIYPRVFELDAPYSIPETSLRSAIHIPADFQYGGDGRTPVLLVPGTGTHGGEAYAPNLTKLLRQSPFGDPVWLNIPGRMCDASARNAEYVAYAIHYLSARCAHPHIAVIAWSQGCITTQWALKYWPSARGPVQSFVALAADFAGTVAAWALCPFPGTQPGTPAVWNQTRNATFIRTLRSGGGDSAYVPTTSIYSATDEVVQPQCGPGASAFLADARGVGVTNCELQLHVPRSFAAAGGLFCSHEAVLYHPLAWALIADAIQHGGPGSLERIDLATVCRRGRAEGIGLVDAARTQALAAGALKQILFFSPKSWREPELPGYAVEEGRVEVEEVVVADMVKGPAVVVASEMSGLVSV